MAYKTPHAAKNSTHFISKAIKPKNKGALHRELGIPQSKTIPAKMLNAAAKKSGKLGERARFAKKLKGFNKR